MRGQKGITLIALIVTIIILLILAGITIALMLGENGILNRAKQAGEEYIKASIKEEIELGITDIQTELASKIPLENLTQQIIINNLPNKMQEELIIEDDLTGGYKGYEYWIDENYVVHIGNKINNDFKVTIKVEDIGTSYIIVSTNATSKFGNIVGYNYVIDGSQKETTTENTYQIENLEPETIYKIKVIAIDELGNRKTSRQITVKTEARTYLYHEGDECIDLTGGWIRTGYNVGDFVKEDTYMNLYLNASHDTKYWNGCNTTNKINLEGYKTICFDIEYDNTMYSDKAKEWYFWVWFATNDTNRLQGYGSDGFTKFTGISSKKNMANTRQTMKLDILNSKDSYITIAYFRWFTGSFNCNLKIYNVWLEK